jgi:hypothetical protein
VDDEREQSERDEGALERRSRSAVVWLLTGALATLAIVVVVRVVDERPAPAPTPLAAPSVEEPEALSSAQVRFAELYLSYLLKTYYVRQRGFCQPLLAKICDAMLKAGLLTSPSSCKSLPNDRFVLAIGQYQNRVGLPVDGKAGPETVRMMLGGDFQGREGMARAFCPGWSAPVAPRPNRESGDRRDARAGRLPSAPSHDRRSADRIEHRDPGAARGGGSRRGDGRRDARGARRTTSGFVGRARRGRQHGRLTFVRLRRRRGGGAR